MGKRVAWADGFLKVGVFVNLQNSGGWSALHWAAACGHLDVISFLLENGADPTLKTVCGSTILDFAQGKDQSIINFLLENT
jgi:ankyrin repeat protein